MRVGKASHNDSWRLDLWAAFSYAGKRNQEDAPDTGVLLDGLRWGSHGESG